jgi:hypothetical protein
MLKGLVCAVAGSVTFLFSACAETVDGPTALVRDGASSAVRLALHGPITASATGSGHFVQNGSLRTFSFSALVDASGRVRGQAQGFARGGGRPVHIRVTCLSVSGNAAWIGGVVTSRKNSFGNEAAFRVVDNGEGAKAPPDGISSLFNSPPPGFAQLICASQPAFGLAPVERGNVQVRSRP